MNEDEFEENLTGYTFDIKKFARSKDYKSALILVKGLKKYLEDCQKVRA